MDAQIGESSACATALLCGVKANFETVGLDARGRFENCKSSINAKVESLMDWALREGKTVVLKSLNIKTAIFQILFFCKNMYTREVYWY